MRPDDAIGTLTAVHVIPLNDLRVHMQRVSCWCVPTLEASHVRLLVVHNSADGRELVEKHGLQ